MNFTQNESQRELAALSRRILTDRLTPERLAGAEAGGDGFDPALWSSLAGAGILAAGLPESVGGAGLGLLEQCSVLILTFGGGTNEVQRDIIAMAGLGMPHYKS